MALLQYAYCFFLARLVDPERFDTVRGEIFISMHAFFNHLQAVAGFAEGAVD